MVMLIRFAGPVDWSYAEDLLKDLLGIEVASGIDVLTIDLRSRELTIMRNVVEVYAISFRTCNTRQYPEHPCRAWLASPRRHLLLD